MSDNSEAPQRATASRLVPTHQGRTGELAKFGYNRDGKSGKLQIVFGLLCTTEGCPVAIEVFDGNVGDPSTVQSQIAKLKERFGLARVVLVGDRGMITQARLEEIVKPGLDWITALRAPAIRSLVAAGAIQLSLFDQRDLAEITAPDYPGERLVVCRNPLLAEERTRKRGELLDATQKLLHIQSRVRRDKKPLRGKDKIALAVGAVINHYKMAKHFAIAITDDDVTFERNTAQITAEAALDGVYVLRTNLKPETLDATSTVKAYKQLAQAERAFRSLKSCSTITTRSAPIPPAPLSSPKQNVPKPPTARLSPSAPMTDCPSTASAHSSATSPLSQETPWRWPDNPTLPSCSIPISQRFRPVPSNSSMSPSTCSQ